ncbi:MAG TPA: glycoside hydrolase family 2 TIM barrel-domain containing protein [Mobilitalea sp.]|nr:glycoside hydrolase family 2 TIM barrel-domain containing protein [Mobilitalea sp.]
MLTQIKPRIQILQNDNWTFMYGDLNIAKSFAFDDSDWYHVGLPHSFGIPYFMENHFYVGYGCYRKTLDMKKEWLGKRLTLEFQGVFQEAEIYLNEALAGSHLGGYTAFTVDISHLVKEGDNQLFVRVNNHWNPRLAPRAGEHVFNGGIYRDVSLIITEPIHISWYGTFVQTPDVFEDIAKILISSEIENDTDLETECLLTSTVEFEGNDIFTVSARQTLSPHQIAEITQRQYITHPMLWHPDNPKLYVLKSRVFVGDQLYDEYETVFGIRWFSFTSREGFFLNGKHYDILGANVHQDHAGWGDAVTHAGIYRDVKLIKDCGMNFIRGSHYPHHTVFAEECDRQGMLFWSELCFWGIGGCKGDGYWNSSAYPIHAEDEKEFEESCIRTLKEMIRTNRNHPSIIVWSMSNEVFFSHKEVLDKARILIKRLVTVSHECDPTRPAASGGAQREGFDLLGDLAGYNGDGASIYIDPGFPSFVSEYGSKISDRPGEYIPSFTDGVEKNYPWRCGKALWCAFHHGSIADRMGHMGFIDYYRLPLQSWYWYRNELLGIAPPRPVKEGVPYALKLSADRSRIKTDGTEDTQLIVSVTDRSGNRISNSMPVTLEVIKGGGIFPTGRTIELSPEKENLIEGLGAIELRALYSGEIIVTAKAEGLISDEITITAIGAEEWKDQKINLQPSSPSILIPKDDDTRVNIAKNRPVFCSSFAEGFSPRFINDENMHTFWRAATTEPGEWIRQDLEGLKAVNQIIISFAGGNGNPVEISASADGTDYKLLAASCINSNHQVLSLDLAGTEYRCVKVAFPEIPLDIKEIEIY